MQIRVESRTSSGTDLRRFARERVHASLRRLSWLAGEARVVLSRLNGSRGGLDKRCRVELASPQAGPIVISSVARDWRTALDGATGLAAETLMRAWRRAARREHASSQRRKTSASNTDARTTAIP